MHAYYKAPSNIADQGLPLTQHCEGTKCHQMAHIKMVHFTLHEFYLDFFKRHIPMSLMGMQNGIMPMEGNFMASVKLPVRLLLT